MQFFFAHAGEKHETVSAAASHSLLDKWYILLPLYVLSVVAVAYLTYLVSRRSVWVTYNVVLSVLLVAGMIGYTTSAAVSVLSLSVGFAMALLQAIAGLGGKPKNTERREE